MTARLTENERAAFEAMRERLEGVERTQREDDERPVELGPIDPMLAQTFDGSLANLDETEWQAEPKFDGTRIVMEHLEGEVHAYTRRAIERSDLMPDVVADVREGVPEGTILDGEFAFVTEAGGTEFIPIHTAGSKVEERNLSTVYYVFDAVAAAGEWITERPLTERRSWFVDAVEETAHVRHAEVRHEDFQGLFDELVDVGEEGIMLKRTASRYHPGVRSTNWRKVKAFTTDPVLAVGYTAGEGSRADTFGALVMGDGTRYRGRVGSGFTDAGRRELLELFEPAEDRRYPVSAVGRSYTPVEPVVISVRYQEITDHGDLRAPVFVDVHPERSPDEVTPLDG